MPAVAAIDDVEDVSKRVVKYECNYCGGRSIVRANHHLHIEFVDEAFRELSEITYASFHIEDDIGNSRKICPRCLIKMFDKLIPKQKKSKKDANRKRYLRPKK